MSIELEKIKQKIAHNKDYLRETYGVEEIGVFGSYARGDATSQSDIDIVVELNHEKVPVGLIKFTGMQMYLEDLLGRKVDLVTKKGINPFLREAILKQLIIV